MRLITTILLNKNIGVLIRAFVAKKAFEKPYQTGKDTLVGLILILQNDSESND